MSHHGIKKYTDVINQILAVSNLAGQWTAELICDHHNTPASVFRLNNDSGKEKVLKIEKSESLKLIKEVKFILNNTLSNIYPHIFLHGYIGTDIYYCIMESLYSYESFIKLYNENRLNHKHIIKLLGLLEAISDQSTKRGIGAVYKEYYLRRLLDRLNGLKNSWLVHLLNEQYIFINKKKYLNLTYAIDSILLEIKKPFFSFVAPYPGDLHFEHIFINSDELIKIIDPKGSEYLPLEYDLGKILHSLHGGYNFLSTLNFQLSIHGTNRFEFYCQFPYIRDRLLTFLEQELVSIWGTATLKYAYLSEVFHFVSLLIHHIGNKKEVLGLYCRTVELIDNYYERFVK